MKKYKIIFFILLFSLSTTSFSEQMSRYVNKIYNYSILIPDAWERDTVDLKYKHIIFFSRGLFTKIKITAAVKDDKETDKWKNWKNWLTNGLGYSVIKILETKEITFNKGINGKLIVIEYTMDKQRMLHRILLTNIKNNLLVVECYTTLNTFYKYSRLFDAVMSSLKVQE